MKKISNYFLTTSVILFGVGLIAFSSSNINTVNNSLDLFLNAVFPSLFPFLIVSELISHTFVISLISSKFEKIMPAVFNVSAIGAYPFVMGLISGYPVGAKIVANLRAENKITRSDGDKLLIFTNNAGPLFIVGSIGTSIYLNSSIGFLLYIVHFISCIVTGIAFGHLYKLNYRDYAPTSSKELEFSTLGEIVGDTIKKAFHTLSIVCGFVILFSLIISMLQVSGILSFIGNTWTEYVIFGILEITSGIKLISTISDTVLPLQIIVTSFLLGFGGFSVLLQVWSVISKTDLSIKPYILGKIFNGIISAMIMTVVVNMLWDNNENSNLKN